MRTGLNTLSEKRSSSFAILNFHCFKAGIIRGAIPYLGKLTSCQSGLTPRNQLGSFPTKNDNVVTEFGNADLDSLSNSHYQNGWGNKVHSNVQ